MELFATAAAGTEPMLRDELRSLRFRGVRADRGGVHFEGGWDEGLRACLWSRIALRVLWPVGAFPCESADDLYAGVSALDLSPFLTPRHTLAVSAVGRAPGLDHTGFVAQRVKDAIVDRLRDAQGARPSVSRDDPDVPVFVHLARGTAQVYLDLAGRSLSQRGWRVQGGAAPLKESLAAALVQLSGWQPEQPLLDPCCGAGTLLIEAAHRAERRAPGLARERFAVERWADFDAARAARAAALRAEARAAGESPEAARARRLALIGFDVDPTQLAAARANAAAAGVGLRLTRGSMADASPALMASASAPTGWVLANPPYGQRLDERGALEELAHLLRRAPGWGAVVLVPAGTHLPGLPRPDRVQPLRNGDLDCRALVWQALP